VAEVVEAQRGKAGGDRHGLEPLEEARALERPPEHGMREHEIVELAEASAFPVRGQGVGHTPGERYRAVAAARLRRRDLAAHEALADADAPRVPVDVAPAQRDQLALAEAGERRRQIQHAIGGGDSSGCRLGYRQQLAELGR
jgi:hypothetical protein